MAAPSSAGFDPRENDPVKRRAKLLQQRQDRAAAREKHERFVLSAADQVAERAFVDLNNVALRQPHLVPELLSLKEQLVRLPMPIWRATAQQAESQHLSIQHVALRQAIAEQNHYSTISSAKPIIKGAIIAADHTTSASRVTARDGRRRPGPRHLARLRAKYAMKKTAAKDTPMDCQNKNDTQIELAADATASVKSSSQRKPKRSRPSRKLRVGQQRRHRQAGRQKRKKRDMLPKHARNNKSSLQSDRQAGAPSDDGGQADHSEIEALVEDEHDAALGLHTLSDAHDEHAATDSVIEAALTAVLVSAPPMSGTSPPGGTPPSQPQHEDTRRDSDCSSSQSAIAPTSASSVAASNKSSGSMHSRSSMRGGSHSAGKLQRQAATATMHRAASFKQNPSPTPHQRRTAAAQQRKQHLALQRSRSARNVHGFDLAAHAELSHDAQTKTSARRKRATKAAKGKRKAPQSKGNHAHPTDVLAEPQAESPIQPAAERLFRVQPPPAPKQGGVDQEKNGVQRLSRSALSREIPPVLSSWQGHVPSQYPLLWGGTRKGLSRWPTVGAGEGLCGVMGQQGPHDHSAAPTSQSPPPSHASILRYYAERKAAECSDADPTGSGLREKVHQVHPGGVLMSVAATPAAPPRLHGGGTAQGETPHPLTGQAVLPPNVLTRLTPKQRLALGKEQLKKQAEQIATLIQSYTAHVQQRGVKEEAGGVPEAKHGETADTASRRPMTPVRSARPVGANGLFDTHDSPSTAHRRQVAGKDSPLRPMHPFDASWGGVLPSTEQVQARDNHNAAIQLEVQQRREWLRRREGERPA